MLDLDTKPNLLSLHAFSKSIIGFVWFGKHELVGVNNVNGGVLHVFPESYVLLFFLFRVGSPVGLGRFIGIIADGV